MDTTRPPIHHYDEDLRPDVLISRLIDGEANEHDRQTFQTMADREPLLWRELALRHEDAARLGESVEPVLDRLSNVSAAGVDPSAHRRGPFTMPVALSGWAAMIIIGLTWAIVSYVYTNGQPTRGSVVRDGAAALHLPFTYMDHLERYAGAPWVLGEMQPHALEIETLPDGRVRVRFLRRIEEVLTLDSESTLDQVIDVNTGRFIVPLRQLREGEDDVPRDNALINGGSQQ